jgi:hypothetical protein
VNLALYLVYGDKRYVAEAIQSAHSLRANCPRLLAWALSDQPLPAGVFDEVRRIEPQPGPPLLTKAHALATADLPDDARVLFLDTDTYILGDLRPMFGLLDRFDLALTHAFMRETGPKRLKLPLGYQEFSSGVMLYRPDRVRELFVAWHARYQASPGFYGNNDQPALTEEIYLSGAQTYVLPPEFNVRTGGKHYVSGFAYILHGRGNQLKLAIQRINQGRKPRVWNPEREERHRAAHLRTD